jgi:hypothetical protein
MSRSRSSLTGSGSKSSPLMTWRWPTASSSTSSPGWQPGPLGQALGEPHQPLFLPPSQEPSEETPPPPMGGDEGIGPGLSLLDFTRRTYARYEVQPHHQVIAQKLEAIERGEITRLLLSVPPRHGKTELASIRFPAWYLGKHPRARFIATSYGATLAFKISRRVRNLVASPLYQRLFPGREIAGDASAVAYWVFQQHEGSYLASGVGGGITGEGCDVLLVDDPVKDAKEALSKTVRDATWDWFTSTAYTRQDAGIAAIVVIQTRWHEDDLTGRLLQEMEEGNERWEVVRLPALADADDPLGRTPGEALWPERFPVKRLQVIRATIKPAWFEAQYQQTPPQSLGGRFFRGFQPLKDGKPYHVWPEAQIRERYHLAAKDSPTGTKSFGAAAAAGGWTVWCGLDGGVRDPWCVLWFARPPDRSRVVVWREWYQAGVTVRRQAKRLKQQCWRIEGQRMAWRSEGGESLPVPATAVLDLDHIRVDPALFTNRANVGVSDASVYWQEGVPVRKGFNDRVPGWRRLQEALEEGEDGLPGLILLEGACADLQRTLPRLTADPDNPEDIEDGQEDHSADALRYGINPAATRQPDRRGLEIVTTMGGGDRPWDAPAAQPFGSAAVGSESRW